MLVNLSVQCLSKNDFILAENVITDALKGTCFDPNLYYCESVGFVKYWNDAAASFDEMDDAIYSLFFGLINKIKSFEIEGSFSQDNSNGHSYFAISSKESGVSVIKRSCWDDRYSDCPNCGGTIVSVRGDNVSLSDYYKETAEYICPDCGKHYTYAELLSANLLDENLIFYDLDIDNTVLLLEKYKEGGWGDDFQFNAYASAIKAAEKLYNNIDRQLNSGHDVRIGDYLAIKIPEYIDVEKDRLNPAEVSEIENVSNPVVFIGSPVEFHLCGCKFIKVEMEKEFGIDITEDLFKTGLLGYKSGNVHSVNALLSECLTKCFDNYVLTHGDGPVKNFTEEGLSTYVNSPCFFINRNGIAGAYYYGAYDTAVDIYGIATDGKGCMIFHIFYDYGSVFDFEDDNVMQPKFRYPFEKLVKEWIETICSCSN